MKWNEFIRGFKTLVHDVAPTNYQRMEYLKMYLSSKVKSTISILLEDSKQY